MSLPLDEDAIMVLPVGFKPRVDGKVISNFYSENFLKAWCFGEEIFLDYKPEEDTYVAYSCNEDSFCKI